MVVPTHVLSDAPSAPPSDEPSLLPSPMPSDELSLVPSKQPTPSPTPSPTAKPSSKPSVSPSVLPSDEPSVLPSDEPSVLPSDEPSVLPSDEPSVLPSDEPSISAAPSISEVPTSTFWGNPRNSAFSPLSTDDGTDVETITLDDDATAIVDIGFAYNWFGEDLTHLVIQSNGQLFMDTSNDSTFSSVVSIGDYSGSRIAFANTDLNPSPYYVGAGAVKVGRKSGADESFEVSFEDVKWYGSDEVINVQVELFPNGDIIFCYGNGNMAGNDYYGNPLRMAAGVENFDLGKAFPIPDDPFHSDGITTEWPTDSCWKFQMP
eukprot:scaffold3450_cov287-Chaetoceros_neogracile.AAC.1